jgi:hypothetical protein
MPKQESRMNRREFLAALGGAGTAAVAGCSGSDGQTGEGQEDGSGEGENGTPVNGGSNETDLGNGQQNGSENGSENGGQNGQPEELLEAAKILDGEGQELDSLKLGEDNDEAVTSQNLTLETKGSGEAEYNASIKYEGEEPGFAEELEQMLQNPETINLGEKINIGQIQYEQIKNQITENKNATININIQQRDTSQELSLDLEILENLLDVEKLKQVSQENLENAFNYIPEESTVYEPSTFRNYDAMQMLLEHLGIEYEGHGDLEIFKSIDGMPELDWSDAKYHIVSDGPSRDTPTQDPTIFSPDIPGLDGNTTVNLPDYEPFEIFYFSPSNDEDAALTELEEVSDFQKEHLRGEVPSRDYDWPPLQTDYIQDLDVVLKWNDGATLTGNEISHEAISSVGAKDDLHAYGVRIDDGEPVFVENVLTHRDGEYVPKFDDIERNDPVNMMFPIVDGRRINQNMD